MISIFAQIKKLYDDYELNAFVAKNNITSWHYELSHWRVYDLKEFMNFIKND